MSTMKKFAKYFLITIGSLLLIVVILIFRPVPIVSEEKAIAEQGIVTDVYVLSGGNDIVFRLKDTKRRFYINRGTERGLNPETLKEKLTGQEVVLKYPKYWTPLDWNNSVKHLAKVEFGEEVIFNELR